MKDP